MANPVSRIADIGSNMSETMYYGVLLLDLTRGDTPERSSDLLFNQYKEIPTKIWSDRRQVAPT